MSADDLNRRFPAPDLEFGLGGQLSSDLNTSIEIHRAPRAESFTRFEANVRVAPVGGDIVIDWYLNDVVIPDAQVTIVAGETYGFADYTMVLAEGDTLEPQILSVGTTTPGTSITFRARG